MEETPNNGWAGQFYPVTLALLRMVAGLLFWQHGAQKLFGWFGGTVVPPFSLFWFAGVLEFIGAPFLMVGLFTQPVAFFLSGEMAVAFFTQHLPKGFWPIANQGEPAALFCFIFLLLATAGPGAFSLDGLLARRAAGRQDWLSQRLSQFYPVALPILRLMTGLLFWQHGATKLFGLLGGRPVPFPQLRWFAGVLEFFGSPLIALGALTRPLAFILAGEMATAFWTSHFPRGFEGQGFWPIQNAGEPAVLFCFIYLFLVTAGPGRLSVAGLLSRKSL